jgi:putative cardiolipin synthase
MGQLTEATHLRLDLKAWILPVPVLAALGGCVTLPELPDVPDQVAMPAAKGGALDSLIASAEAAHPGQSGFRLVSDGTEALVVRIQSAKLAQRSLDVQTYIWHTDMTGVYLGNQLLDSADRGVRVRLLIDDLDARAKNEGFAALAAHPNVEVKLFNPWVTRDGLLSQAGETALSFRRINRRMHNKSWIADNRIAIVGGRNVGDEYFGAAQEMNFVDLDFTMVGPIVRDVSATFDEYWNSPSAFPMEVLAPDAVNEDALARLRRRIADRAAETAESRYAIALRGQDVLREMFTGDRPVQWSSKYEFIADDPGKVKMTRRDARRAQVGLALLPLLREAARESTIISPYFVPGRRATKEMIDSASSGTRVRVLTNSLVANDVAAVHGGYSRHRRKLLKGGVELWELKPAAGTASSSLFGSSGASLHTKAFVMDGRKVFVGSYNVDPRSTWLNCEQGVLVEDEVLAGEVEALFAESTNGKHAWRVTLDGGGLRWSDGSTTFDRDPEATNWQRIQAWMTRILHLDAHL